MLNSLKTSELEALFDVSRAITAHLDLDSVLEAIMSATNNVMQAEASSLILIDEETGELLFHIARGEKAEIVKPIRMQKTEGIVGSVIGSGEGVIVNDVAGDPRFFSKIDEQSGFVTRSVLCVPMSTNNGTLGAIEVINKLDGTDFSELDMTFCGAIAGQAAIAIENALLHKKIIQTERLAAIGQTVAGLAHCIKNVLYGIQGGSYMVDLGLRKDDETKLLKGWEIVKKNSSFMHNLVLDMLTYSKDRKPEYESADIYEITETVCDLIEAKAGEQGVTIKRAPRTFSGEVVLDATGIRRCILNLAGNAVDACAGMDGGLIGITADAVDDSIVRIVISDNGSGISEEDRSQLFRIFFSTKGSKGTGLGLAVTHKIISEHEGTIEVESAPGKGTQFIISLPLRKKTD